MPPWLRSLSGGERCCVARAAGVAMDAILFLRSRWLSADWRLAAR